MGLLPSISGAWVLSEENLLNDVEMDRSTETSVLLVGLAGNKPYRQRYGVTYILSILLAVLVSENLLSLVNNGTATRGSTTLPTRISSGETTLTRNLAADITLFGRLTVTPEVYWNTTKDLLYKSDIPLL